MGANSLRLAHYQQDEKFYDLCDEEGFLVWAEIPVISKFSKKKQPQAKLMLEELIKKESEYDGVSVIISRRPCALLVKTKEPPVVIDTEKCRSCKACMQIGCPAISIIDGKAKIDTTLCTGCGLCEKMCKFDCICEKSR